MMMERGDYKVVHEPFSYYFYAKEQLADAVHMNVDPDAPLEFEDILAYVLTEAEENPIFFKDMAYHVIRRADLDFVNQFVNTFIIRDPAVTLPSHYKLNPDFTMEEAGYGAMMDLVKLVRQATGESPAVVDGDDLIADAHGVVKAYCEKIDIPFLADSLTWEDGFKEQWTTWEKWHLDAAKSTGFMKDMEVFDFTVQDVPRLKEMYEQVRPLYDDLYEHALRG
jgi:hypothetical protein